MLKEFHSKIQDEKICAFLKVSQKWFLELSSVFDYRRLGDTLTISGGFFFGNLDACKSDFKSFQVSER